MIVLVPGAAIILFEMLSIVRVLRASDELPFGDEYGLEPRAGEPAERPIDRA